MFAVIKAKLATMNTIKALCESAEKYSLQDEQHEPGGEHFLLAALDLPDDTARQAFIDIGADPSAVGDAIRVQYTESLRAMGLTTGEFPDPEPLRGKGGAYEASASGKEVLQRLAAERQEHQPMLGAHVVAIVAAMERSVVARALQTMSIDPASLRVAAEKLVSAQGN